MKSKRWALAMAALAALTLTACEPGTAGSTGTSGGSGVDCDPHGWGPLSNCGGATSTTRTPVGAETTSPPSPVETTAVTTPVETTSPCGSEGSYSSGDGVSTVAQGCPGGDHPWWNPAPDDRRTTSRGEGYTVTVTWIVVSVKITGFRECVIELRSAEPNSGEPLRRRFTTPDDCDAQQVDTVYHPVGR